MYKIILIFIVFYILGWFLFTYKLTEVPPGINGDEAVIGYSASLIAKTGRDSHSKFMPLFTNVSWPDWKQPVTVYSTVLAFKLLGISYFNLRLVSVLFVFLSATLIFFLIKEIVDKKIALISVIIFATIPIIMIQAHFAIENIAPLPFITFWLWMVSKYTKTKNIKYLILAGISLGMSLYSYLGLRLIMPVLTILNIGYICYLKSSKNMKSSLYHVGIFVLSIIPFLLLLLIVRNEYPGAVFASNVFPQEISYYQLLFPYISSFDLSFLFMKGDLTPYHSTGRQGMFLLATLPLFILGFLKIAKDRNPFLVFTLLAFFITPVLYGLPNSIYRASRLLVLIPPFMVITSLGIKNLLNIKNEMIRVFLIVLLMIFITLNYKDFIRDYWFDYPNRVNQQFEKPIHKVFERASLLSKKENLDVYIQENLIDRNRFAYYFFENAYFPTGLKKWKGNEGIPKQSILIGSEHVYNNVILNDKVESLKDDKLELTIFINRENK